MTISPLRSSACGSYTHPTGTRFGDAKGYKPYYGEGRVDVRNGGGDTYDSYCPSNIESPIQPPWRVLPWPRVTGVCPVRVTVAAVKLVTHPADVSSVGRTLDVFV